MSPRAFILGGLAALAGGFLAVELWRWALPPRAAVPSAPLVAQAPAASYLAPQPPTPAPILAAKPPKKGKHSQQWVEESQYPPGMRQAMGRVRKRYAAFFAKLNLPPDKLKQLMLLLVSERMAPSDVIAAGDDMEHNYPQFYADVSKTRAEIREEIHALLGDDDYAEYVDFNTSSVAVTATSRVELTLKDSSTPLTPDQSQQLQALIKKSGQGMISNEVIAAAKQFLSPEQIAAVETVRSQQIEESIRRAAQGLGEKAR